MRRGARKCPRGLRFRKSRPGLHPSRRPVESAVQTRRLILSRKLTIRKKHSDCFFARSRLDRTSSRCRASAADGSPVDVRGATARYAMLGRDFRQPLGPAADGTDLSARAGTRGALLLLHRGQTTKPLLYISRKIRSTPAEQSFRGRVAFTGRRRKPAWEPHRRPKEPRRTQVGTMRPEALDHERRRYFAASAVEYSKAVEGALAHQGVHVG